MPRIPRINAPDLIRHVMGRGNARQAIFLDDQDYRQFVHQLSEAVQEYDIECWNYCLMPNHYHATLQPRQDNLSKAMRNLNGSYASWWNRKYGRVGHVFQGRFKDQIVDRDSYLLNLSRYVAMNPVRAKLTKVPDDWVWSSYNAIMGTTEAPPFLSVESTLSLFGESDDAIRRESYKALVASEPSAMVDDRIRSNTRVLGSRAFREFVRKLIRSGRDGGST